MQFNGFKKEAITFLEDLNKNNNKKWFEDNRHIWEKNVLEPNKAFVEEMGETLQILVPTIKAIPKASASLFKIYRDVRFSKDKTPLKEKVGILFWQGTAHRMSSSSFYFFYNKDEYYIASGMRLFKPPVLKAYRSYIKDEKKAKELDDILNDLKQKGYNICEAQYKRLPKDFKKEYKYPHLALFGAMNASISYKIDDRFFSLDIVDFAFEIFNDMKDLQTWLYEMTLTVKD